MFVLEKNILFFLTKSEVNYLLNSKNNYIICNLVKISKIIILKIDRTNIIYLKQFTRISSLK